MKKKKPDPDTNTKNLLEWSVFGLSCLLIVAVIAHLVGEGLRESGAAPRLETTLVSVEKTGDRVVAELLVHNRGGVTAEELRIALVADFPSGEQRGEIGFDHVPRLGSRRGRVEFLSSEDPRTVTPLVLAYREP